MGILEVMIMLVFEGKIMKMVNVWGELRNVRIWENYDYSDCLGDQYAWELL